MTETTTAQPPIAENLFEFVDGDPVLIGSRCVSCGTVAFPYQGSCPRCTSEDVRRSELATRGTLWTWTIQSFAPKSPPYLEGQSLPLTGLPAGRYTMADVLGL